jgi:hypothetical protein
MGDRFEGGGVIYMKLWRGSWGGCWKRCLLGAGGDGLRGGTVVVMMMAS